MAINSIIEKAYLNYLKSEGKISHKVEINGYEINFLKNMQFNLKEKFRQRPVLRSHKCPENIIRINKFDQNFLSKNTDIVQIDNEKIQVKKLALKSITLKNKLKKYKRKEKY